MPNLLNELTHYVRPRVAIRAVPTATLGAVPGPVGAVGGDVVGLVAGGGVPADRQAQAGQAEGDGAFDRPGFAVVGLTDAGQLFGVLDGHFDGPAGGVALHDLAGGGMWVGGDQGEVVAAAGLGLAEEDDGDRLWSEDRVPQAVDGGGVHGAVGSVAVRRGGGEGGGAGQVGKLGQFRALFPGPAAAAGTRRRRLVEGGVLAEPGGPADLIGQFL